MTISKAIYFPFRLAWRQLIYDKVRFLTAISGVIFACILVFMQLGFKDSLFESATLLQRVMTGQVYIIHKQSEAIWRLNSFPRQRLYRAMSIPGVEDVTILYVGQAPWKNPVTGVNRTALILGIEPRSTVYPLKGLDQHRKALQMRDAVLFDELSRPEFGPIKDMLKDKPSVPVEVAGRKVDVIGTFQMGITFSADGNLIVNDTTFFKLFPMKSQDGVDVGIITLKDGADPKYVQAELRKILPEDVKVLTRPEYVEDEKAYWNDLTPIGYIFNFGVIMGLVVGLVIVYQVLFNDITNHLHEYATLKAIGYEDFYFVKVVMSSSAILALMGFVPGWLLCLNLYSVVEDAIFIEMNLTASKAFFVFVLIAGMCLTSAVLAVRKLRSSSPVDVFS
ncbi:MAG TPA: ABC transporter permease DevC [Alphaproteobacteria bacterium]|nr:ABC transporter permease DevC [Alphaproteobacteria bacterium]HNS43872.1 ABC transporter permease DevC [Alphaproteobacteria bacterium]